MKAMRTLFLGFVVLILSSNSALAQVYVGPAAITGTPEKIKTWSDFLKTNPTDYDLRVLIDEKILEPYKGWLVQEAIKRNSRHVLRYALVFGYMEEYSDLIWSKGKFEEDMNGLIYIINFGSKKDMEKAVNRIIEAPRYQAVDYEWIAFGPSHNFDNVSDEKVARLWSALHYYAYPTDSDLVSVISYTGSEKIKKLAIGELFSRYLPDEKLLSYLRYESLELKELVLARLSFSLYPMLNKGDLEMILWLNIEPFSSIAKAMLESGDWEWRRLEKQRETLLKIMTEARVVK